MIQVIGEVNMPTIKQCRARPTMKGCGWKTTKKDFEGWLNRRISQGMKIDGLHATYYLTHVNLRGSIRNKIGSLLRKHNPEIFGKLHKKLDNRAMADLR